MSLTLFYHPLASFCWKVPIALYEKEIEFRREIVNLGDATSSTKFFGWDGPVNFCCTLVERMQIRLDFAPLLESL